MRTRLTRNERRADILNKARRLIKERGLDSTEMEDIRRACGISRGGLYHHFQNKRAVLDALVEDEVTQLAEILKDIETCPIPALLQAGSGHLGNDPGVISDLRTTGEKLDYLFSLEQAQAACLSDILRDRLKPFTRPKVDPGHVAELFLTINAHINRREILNHWTSAEAAGFAATGLEALAPFLKSCSELEPIISKLKQKAATS